MWDRIFDALRTAFGDRVLVVLACVGILSLGIWAVYVFFSEGTKYASQKYYDLKLSVCVEAARAVAQMSTANDASVIRSAALRFDELFWGELVLVEDATLEAKMVAFRELISDSASGELQLDRLIDRGIDRKGLRSAALHVSQACFDLLQPRWIDLLIAVFRSPTKT